jgi:hypothetical protein
LKFNKKTGLIDNLPLSSDQFWLYTDDPYNPNEVKVYPNPTSANSEFTIEIPEGMVGGKITLFDASGTKVRTVNAVAENTILKTSELSAGNYFIEIQKETVTMKKQVIIIE